MDSLLDLVVQAQPTRRGYRNRLEKLWSEAHPQGAPPWRPSSGKYTKKRPPRPKRSLKQRLMITTATPAQSLKEKLATAHKSWGPVLSTRLPLGGRWYKKDPKLLDEIDEEMVTLWENECTDTNVENELPHICRGNKNGRRQQESISNESDLVMSRGQADAGGRR